MNNPRKSETIEVRRIIAKADYKANRDLSWARMDPDAGVREWATEADYSANRDLSWAKKETNPRIKHWINVQKKTRRSLIVFFFTTPLKILKLFSRKKVAVPDSL